MTNPLGVELALYKNHLDAILDDMAYVLVRTGYSPLMREQMDFATAIADAHGNVLSQGVSIPLQLAGLEYAFQSVSSALREEAVAGDIYILNDPFAGGSHLPDIFMFTPFVVNDRLLGFVGTVAHHSDVGGRVPGSNASDSTEVYQEGLRVPLSRLYSKGIPNESVFGLLRANVRLPNELLGDLEAQRRAVLHGARRLAEMYEELGPDTAIEYGSALLDYSEHRTREEFASLPDGTYKFVDYIDDDGVGSDDIAIKVKVDVVGNSISVDFAGSSPQVAGAINATLSWTKSAVYLVLACLIDKSVPKNSGFFRCIDIHVERGSILNVELPGATAGRAIAGYRVVDALFGALAAALPDRVFAAGDGGNTFITFAGTSVGKPFVLVDSVVGAWGARPNKDGLEGNSLISINLRNTSVEFIESRFPIRIDEYRYCPDSGGAGRWRGGNGFIRSYTVLSDETLVQVRSDRRKYRPYGLFGGAAGSPSRNIIVNRESGLYREVPAKFLEVLSAGDTFVHESPGGGGYGASIERPVQDVVTDVIRGRITAVGARESYGVWVMGESGVRTLVG